MDKISALFDPSQSWNMYMSQFERDICNCIGSILCSSGADQRVR
jgi:hypothetical protein